MAHRTPSSQPRHAVSSRRASKRRVKNEVLQHELELRDHAPSRATEVPRRAAMKRNSKNQKTRAPFWKIVRRATAVLAFLGVLELGAASLTAKPFRVRALDVTGCELTDENAVMELSQPLVGQNFLRAKTKTIQAQIEAMPTVKSARVSRVLDWPPRLHVEVEERAAFASVGAGKDWWVVDESGVAFRRAAKNDANLYAITSPKFAPQLGAVLPEKEWKSVVEITTELQNANPKNWPLRRIYFDKDGSAALRLAGGFNDETLVRLGSDHWSEKLIRAQQALAFFERSGKRASVLNLVSYETPQWTPRAAPPSSTPAVSTTAPAIKSSTSET